MAYQKGPAVGRGAPRGGTLPPVYKSDRLSRPRQILSASEQIAIRIQRRIRDEELRAGARLGTEEQLAREYGVSRPTLREALRILSSARLVRPVSGPKGGIFVARTPEESVGRSVSDSIALLLDLQGTSIEELLEARTLLEVPLARFAATRAGEETLREMREAVETAAANPDDDDLLRQADARFHRAIASASGNSIIGSVMEWAFEVLQPRLKDLIGPALDERVILDQHRAILRAVEVGDPTAAEQAMRAHLGHLSQLVRAVKGPPSSARAAKGAGARAATSASRSSR
jgi:GntR family transcriptional regulator, transcriptional repressor for pyruvate dehydrogenase complex